MQRKEESLEVISLLKEVMVFFKHNMNKAFEKSGLTLPQGLLLSELGKYEKMKIHDLGGRLGMTDSTVSGIVDRLEKQGIVERTRSLEDKRVVYVSFSNDYKEIFGNLRGFMNKKIENIVSKASPQELSEVRNGLNILKRLMSGVQ